MTTKALSIVAAVVLTGASALAAPQAPTAKVSSAAAPSSKSSASASAKKPSSKKKRRTKREPTQKAPTPARISEIQSALARGGYYNGNPNGRWDSNTVAAMQKFQSSNGLDPTGNLNALSLQKLGLGSSVAGVSAPTAVTPPSPAASTAPAHTVPSQASPSPNAAPSSTSSSAPPASTPPKR
jgi:peptidoglycan hydrolase-like protein with peptidoglycan-binding domain